MLLKNSVTRGAHFLRRIRRERPIGRLQQFRLQFRAVLFQIQNVRCERHLIVAVRQYDRLAATCLGNEFAELALSLDVRKLWNHHCSVTGSSTKAALEASHIKRWADSNDTERLDPNNGLLLTANLHKLFDAGLISFEDSGEMMVSSKLSKSERAIFGLAGRKLIKMPSPQTANYLLHHRTKFME